MAAEGAVLSVVEAALADAPLSEDDDVLSEDDAAPVAGALPLSRKSLTYQPEPLS